MQGHNVTFSTLYVTSPKESIFYAIKRIIKMRIAVCDDDKSFIDRIKPMINFYANQHRLDLVVDSFPNGESLLASERIYDMIFLDYKMNGMNGLSVAKSLRERNILSVFVFVTSYPDFVYEAFKVSAFRFCTKPINSADINEIFDGYFQKYGYDYPLAVISDRETITVHTKDVAYLESCFKNCVIHMKDKKEIVCASTLIQLQKLFPKTHFYKVHKSFYVNLNYIEKFDKQNITLINGDKTPYVSRNTWKAFKHDYMEYVNGNTEGKL